MNRFNKLTQQFLRKTSLDAPVVCFDLGSAHTRMTVDGKLVFFDRSCFVTKKFTDHVIALGSNKVHTALSGNSQLESFCPVKQGKVADIQKLSVFLQALLQKYVKNSSSLPIVRPTIYCNLPSNLSKVQEEALRKSLEHAGGGIIIFISSSESIHNLIRVSYKNVNNIFAIDIGAEISNIVFLFSDSDPLERSIVWGADLFTHSIIEYVRDVYKVLLCNANAEKIKHEIASLPMGSNGKNQSLELTVRAKDLISNLPTTVTVQSSDFEHLFSELLSELIEVFELVFSKLNSEQVEAISENGLFLLGGGSQLRHLDSYLIRKLRIPVTIIRHPDTAIIRGVELARKQYEIS
ncbi:MAG: rod shape-determining protein [Patescibacteria group bacterium]